MLGHSMCVYRALIFIRVSLVYGRLGETKPTLTSRELDECLHAMLRGLYRDERWITKSRCRDVDEEV